MLSSFHSGINRLMNLFFLVIFVMHVIGCLWFYQAKMQDYGPETWVYRANLLDASDITLYLYSIYFVLTTVTTIGFGDVIPFSTGNTTKYTRIILAHIFCGLF